MKKPYRPNAGIVVFNRTGEVLVGDRIQYPGMFQFPQGGLDDGEDPLEGALRELYEETSLKLDPPPAGELKDWLHYDFPLDVPVHLRSYQGQKQKWFFFFWEGDPSTLVLDHHEQEFASLQWKDFDLVVRDIIEFKKPVYLKILEEGKRIINEYLKNHL